MKKILLTLLLPLFVLLGLSSGHAIVDYNGEECIDEDIRVERVSEDKYHFSGHIDLPDYCYKMDMHVPYVPEIKSKQRIWGTIFFEKIHPSQPCAAAVKEQKIDIHTPAYEVHSSAVKSRIAVASDFAWAPIAYIGEPPKYVGDVNCLKPVTIHDESRGLDRLN